MKFYLKTDEENTIIDAITYEHEGYVEYESDSLPVGVHGGWFKLENSELVEYPELKPMAAEYKQLQDDMGTILVESAIDKARISELEASQADMLVEIATLKMGGITE